MRLIEMEQENTDLKVRLADAESGNTGKDSEITKLRRRLQTLEKQNETLQHSNATYEQERRGLEREVWHSHLCRCIVVSIVLHKSLHLLAKCGTANLQAVSESFDRLFCVVD